MTAPAASERESLFPRGRELAGILAFWTLIALLNVTNWFFPPGGQGPPVTSNALLGAFFEAVIWLPVTPLMFYIARRYGDESVSRGQRLAVFFIATVVMALCVDVAVEALRTYVLPIGPPQREGFPRRQRSFSGIVRGRFLNQYVLSLAVLAAGVARDYFVRYQRRMAEASALRAQLAEARFMVLQNQLNPHFLFNTLNAVAALVDRDPPGVRKMIARLSELLRATLEPTTDPEIPLSRELALTMRYLEILEIRFQGRLSTSVDASGDLHAALVPQLVFQPLIENAMKHAVGRSASPSRIDVKAWRDGYDLVLSVADTGAELGGGDEPMPGAGIGLANTRGRLEQLYGDEQELVMTKNDAGGTTVTIRIPYHTRNETGSTANVG
jgi:hypothetical protein